IDPNRNQVLSASYGDEENDHQLRRCFTKEYYTYAGSKKYIKKMERTVAEVIGDALLNTPTAKTVNTSTYLHYITYILLNLNRIFEFNGCITIKYRFYLYQGVQRAREEITDILLDGGRKYNKRKPKNTKKNRRRERKIKE
ncbi:uncharacterized protein EV154DRAFT_401244, partial [Mucor mucedo]|uniref:uncharacterized protein n=1 Tax=Mucor mucedo TaxID=29922 RepID=UPI0022212AB9